VDASWSFPCFDMSQWLWALSIGCPVIAVASLDRVKACRGRATETEDYFRL
jgi:hypothetical protein